MTKIKITLEIAQTALSGPVIPQMWTCSTCNQEMDITDGLTHILYDCQPDDDNSDPLDFNEAGELVYSE